MAGMLAGVECARRRRLHQSGASPDSALAFTRKPSFCLYTPNNETRVFSQKRMLIQADEDQKLGEVAREAKGRLDERLRSQRKSEPKRRNSQEKSKGVDGKCLIRSCIREVFGSKKMSVWFVRHASIGFIG
ncbi:hypothetical protein HRI_002094100 [Hibiscus trionum]|uniref:Uncharacterized protein n=1 Tax=Hibiscus trionum TaxID=183268 RepID=A0A9W7HX07_HIBTR|nr:hypothetical protein HRI_002094100 [Hibiscus trionum]